MCAGQHGLGPVAVLAVLGASLPLGVSGHAQAPGSETLEGGGRVLVLVLPVDAAHADTADALTELLIGSVATSDRATSIVGKEELQAQLEQSDEATLECIGSAACLARVGVQLGVSEVVAATLARRDERWVFDLRRLDPHSGESTAHAFREVEGDVGALADALTAALASFDEVVVAPATLRIAVDVPGAEVTVDGTVIGVYEDTPLEAEELPPGTHRVVVRAEGHRSWERSVELEPGDVVRIEAGLTAELPAPGAPSVPPPPLVDLEPPAREGSRWSPVLWIGVGLTVVTGALALGFGISSQREPASGANRAEALAFVDDRRRDARIANASLGIAIGGLGLAGLGLWLSELGGGVSGRAGLRIAPRHRGLAMDWSTRW